MINSAVASRKVLLFCCAHTRLREYTSNMYGTLAYYLSKLALELPLLIVLPLLENTLTFWGIDYHTGAFFKFFLVMLLTV